MGDSYTNNQSGGSDSQNQRQSGRNNFRGGRAPNNREGGFRIRLSDNEMRAARSLQEAFNLRSTVAVLGFALRTLAQMLEDGNLDNLVNEYRSQASSNDQQKRRDNRENLNNVINAKPNPFARPEKPLKDSEQLISPSDEPDTMPENHEDKDANKELKKDSEEINSTNTREQE